MRQIFAEPNAEATPEEMQAVFEAQADDRAILLRNLASDQLHTSLVAAGFEISDRDGLTGLFRGPLGEVWVRWNDTHAAFRIEADAVTAWHLPERDEACDTVRDLVRAMTPALVNV